MDRNGDKFCTKIQSAELAIILQQKYIANYIYYQKYQLLRKVTEINSTESSCHMLWELFYDRNTLQHYFIIGIITNTQEGNCNNFNTRLQSNVMEIILF